MRVWIFDANIACTTIKEGGIKGKRWLCLAELNYVELPSGYTYCVRTHSVQHSVSRLLIAAPGVKHKQHIATKRALLTSCWHTTCHFALHDNVEHDVSALYYGTSLVIHMQPMHGTLFRLSMRVQTCSRSNSAAFPMTTSPDAYPDMVAKNSSNPSRTTPRVSSK